MLILNVHGLGSSGVQPVATKLFMDELLDGAGKSDLQCSLAGQKGIFTTPPVAILRINKCVY